MKLFILLLIFCSAAHAFTLNNNFAASFGKRSVKVFVAIDSACSQGVTPSELESLIEPAVDDFWNKVPTSKLRLNAAGFSDPIPNLTNINSAVLCAPTDAACVTAANGAGKEVIPPVDEIIISCNSEPLNFGDNTVIAVTVPNKFDQKKIKGAVILINDMAGSQFASMSRDDQIGVLSHEIGHAIGLGHSDDEAALMYYRTVNQRTTLGQDDIDGVTYLYGMKVDGCGLFGSALTIKELNKGSGSDSDDDPPSTNMWQMGASLVLMIMLAEILRLLKRAKTCPS